MAALVTAALALGGAVVGGAKTSSAAPAPPPTAASLDRALTRIDLGTLIRGCCSKRIADAMRSVQRLAVCRALG